MVIISKIKHVSENSLNPRNIRTSAEFYDSVELVDQLYDKGVEFVITQDGGAVIDLDSVNSYIVPKHIYK